MLRTDVPPSPWEIQKVSPEFSFTVLDYNSYVKVAILGNLCGCALPWSLGREFLEKNAGSDSEGRISREKRGYADKRGRTFREKRGYSDRRCRFPEMQE